MSQQPVKKPVKQPIIPNRKRDNGTSSGGPGKKN
jgi:hypothetical protein